MRKTLTYSVALLMSGLIQSCSGGATQEESVESDKMNEPAKIEKCNVKVGNMVFTNSLNGADSCVNVLNDTILEFTCGEFRDIFNDPNDGSLSNNNLPMLLTKVDNTKPFTLEAKVTPGFTEGGVYKSANLMVYANDSLWQKLCYEEDEHGLRRVVTGRTIGRTDDCNHEVQTTPSLYFRITSNINTVASYYSTDKKNWYLVRFCQNQFPDSVYVGVASQAPREGECKSLFEEISLVQESPSDLRMGN